MKKIFFFRVSLSIKKEDSFYKIKKIFYGKKNIIEVRDEYSKRVLQDLGIENVRKKLDPVFFDSGKSNINKKVSIKKIFKDFTVKDLEGVDFKGKKV
jgi:polysaccharide pyruvyl transferase WcaK-like protein